LMVYRKRYEKEKRERDQNPKSPVRRIKHAPVTQKTANPETSIPFIGTTKKKA